MKVKSEPEDFDCNSDDFGLDNVVLKWISDRCETKKRKRFNFVGLNKETLETCSSVKLESPNFQHNGDIHDELEDPLIGWKSELFKNIKSSDEDLLELNRDWPAPIDVKVEVPESETANVNILKTDVPCPTTEPQYCSLNEVSYEYTEDSETRLDVGLPGCETKEPQRHCGRQDHALDSHHVIDPERVFKERLQDLYLDEPSSSRKLERLDPFALSRNVDTCGRLALAISPASRERLCRAMRLSGLDENECHRKLKQLLHLDVNLLLCTAF
ncbi:hypothetical protein GOBAR_AA33188 [Gossypium barbadense]|uniref:Uncharacterized protein n=1 Tax=Gossypium barbadense TaxID=3634 RepID=A0A2P5W8S9_GOSBA|nr:hypothetical protein GOBAR_AA33188 [Gossypium barbadense]